MFHLHVRYTSRDGGGSSDAARQYLAREGRYRTRGDQVRWVRSLHMPAWVDGDSAPLYWRAAEGRHSRVNARTALMLEFAVPKQLPVADQDALVVEMLERLSATGVESDSFLRLPVTAAVHEGYGRNPHVHALLSLSLNDGIARDETTWFRRHSPRRAEQGGARRSEYVCKRRWLFRVRALWSTLANAALVRQGMQPVLDHRSHAARGLRLVPQIHLGPRVAEMWREGFDSARARRIRAIQEANDVTRELETEVFRRRQTLIEAESEEAEWRAFEQSWRDAQEAEWLALLREHPLAGSSEQVRGHATALVLESDRTNLRVVGQALDLYPDVRVLANLLGADWMVVSTPAGFWAVKPGCDQVVLLGRGYIATDGVDEDSVRAVVCAVPMLRMNAPVVAVWEGIRAATRKILDALGHEWPLTPISPSPRTAKLDLAGKKSVL